MPVPTFNGVQYPESAFEGLGYKTVVTAGTGDDYPRWQAMLVDAIADMTAVKTTGIASITALHDETEGFRDDAETALAQIEAIVVNGLVATSTTSLAIAGSGSKVFTTVEDLDANYPFVVGAWMKAVSIGDTAKWMAGTVTAVNLGANTITMNVEASNGSGTLTDWRLIGVGQPGQNSIAEIGDYSVITTFRLADHNLTFDSSNSDAGSVITNSTVMAAMLAGYHADNFI